MTSRTDPAPSQAGSQAGGQAGFTLIEVLVVVLLLGLVGGIVLGRGAPRSATLDLRGAAGELGRTMRLARTRAITGNRAVLVRVDVPGRSYAMDGERARALSPAFAVSLVSVAPGAGTGGMTGVSFAPDGSSSGGRVGLAEGGRQVEVDVDWLTGRVTVSPVRAADAR